MDLLLWHALLVLPCCMPFAREWHTNHDGRAPDARSPRHGPLALRGQLKGKDETNDVNLSLLTRYGRKPNSQPHVGNVFAVLPMSRHRPRRMCTRHAAQPTLRPPPPPIRVTAFFSPPPPPHFASYAFWVGSRGRETQCTHAHLSQPSLWPHPRYFANHRF